MPAYQDEIWTCQDGKEIAVKDLHPDHAKNIIRLLLRRKRRQLRILEEMKKARPDLVNSFAEVLLHIAPAFTEAEADKCEEEIGRALRSPDLAEKTEPTGAQYLAAYKELM